MYVFCFIFVIKMYVFFVLFLLIKKFSLYYIGVARNYNHKMGNTQSDEFKRSGLLEKGIDAANKLKRSGLLEKGKDAIKLLTKQGFKMGELMIINQQLLDKIKNDPIVLSEVNNHLQGTLGFQINDQTTSELLAISIALDTHKIANNLRNLLTDSMALRGREDINTIIDRLIKLLDSNNVRGAYNYSGAYQAIMDDCASTSGGYDDSDCGCKYIGSGPESPIKGLQKYDESLNAAAKDRVITGVIDIMKKMGLKDMKTSGSRSEILQSILNNIPNREKNRKTFKQDASAHKALCSALAKHINNHFPGSVNTEGSPELMCQQVSELLYSLFMGLHSEFMGVANDVKKAIMNIRYVQSTLKEQMDTVIGQIDTSNDGELRSQSSRFRAAYDELQKELNRQLTLLQGLLNVNISPAEADLAKILEEQTDIFGMLESFDHKPGSALYSDYISNILTGVGITGKFAEIIDQSLKTVGMKLNEYAKDQNPIRLYNELAKLIVESKVDDKKKEKMIAAAELLQKNFYRSKDIEKKLKEMKIGSYNMQHSSDDGSDAYDSYNNEQEESFSDNYEGGDVRSLWDAQQSSTLDRRVRNKRVVKHIIFSTFNRKLADLLDALVRSIDSMVGKVGNDIPVSDQLDGLRLALANVDTRIIENKNAYLSLVGYYNDVSSVETKQNFIAQLDVVKSYIDTMLQMSMYSRGSIALKEVSSLISQIKQHLDEYADKIKEKFGSSQRSVDGADEHEDDDNYTVEGGAGLGGLSLSGMLTNTEYNVNRKTAHKLKSTLQKFDYYYKAARVRGNLSRSSKEIDNYSENYDEVLGSAIAREIDEVRSWYYSSDKNKRDKLDGGMIDRLKSLLPKAAAIAGLSVETEDVVKKNIQSAIDLHIEQMECRVKLWQTVEAVDQYLRHFTKGLVQNPNDVKDIVSMIEDVSVISNWYNNEAGESLHKVFDTFGTKYDGAGNVDLAPDALLEDVKEHYYEKVRTGAGAVGIPYLAVGVDKFVSKRGNASSSGKQHLKKALSNMKALKNLTSVFAYIGEKFGGAEIHSKIHMSPTQIYKSLLHYVECSAYMVGVGDLRGDTGGNVRTQWGIGVSTMNVSNTIANVADPYNTPGTRGTEAVYIGLGQNNTIYVNNPNGGTDTHLFHAYKRWTAVMMRGTGTSANEYVLQGNVEDDKSNFHKEDYYFAMLVKSMSAKVLTVVGMYDIFHRPYEVSYINPVRMILGAAEDMPKIDNNAVELYIRLPLLVEFYRELFGFTSATGFDTRADAGPVPPAAGTKDDQKIVMLPEMEGIFSGIIDLIFRKNRGMDLPSYSDDDVKMLIREVNNVYAKMSAKYPSSYVRDTINDLVQEVNRRYGLVKRESRNQYLVEFADRYGYSSASSITDERDLEIDILPNETEYEVDRPGPSKKYERVADPLNSPASKDHRFEIKKDQQYLFYKFRCMLDNLLVTDDISTSGKAIPQNVSTQFKHTINATKKQLARVDKSNERFNIVANLIRGTNMLTHTDRTKYVLFHETVVSGLNVLSAIHSILSRVRMNVMALDKDNIGAANTDAILKKYFGFDNAVDRARITDSDYWVGDTTDPARLRPIAAGPAGPAGIAPLAPDGPPTKLINAAQNRRYPEMLSGLLETVFGVSKDLKGLVEVRVEDQIYINWGGLKKVVEDLFSGVKYFLDLLRPYLENSGGSVGKNMIEYYTLKKRPGSYYYLQERLLEQMIVGRLPVDDPAIFTQQNATAPRPYMSLDSLGRVINDTYKEIKSISAGAALGDVLARSVFYENGANANLEDFHYGQSGGGRSYPATSAPATVNWLKPNSLEKLLVNVQGSVKTSFPGVAFRYKHFYDSEPQQQLTENRSLMFMLNQLLARYLHTFIDHNTNKIYMGCVDALINGAFNTVISDVGRTFPDCGVDITAAGANPAPLVLSDGANTTPITPEEVWKLLPVELGRAKQALTHSGVGHAGTTPVQGPLASNVPVAAAAGAFTNPADPKNGQVIFTSLAVMLYNIMSSKDASGNPYYIERDLSAVPSFMKEKFRANMPGFLNLFRELVLRAEMYKNVVNNRDLELKRSGGVNPVIGAIGSKKYFDGIELRDYDPASNNTKLVLNSVLSDVISSGTALAKACAQVMREIADDPKHFETHKGSIDDFKNMYHKTPFMPLSNALYVLKNTTQEYDTTKVGRNNLNEKDFLPFNTLGEEAFKLAYGNRGIISRMDLEPSMKLAQGFESIVSEYNMGCESKFAVNSARANQLVSSLIKGLRYVHNVKNIKGAFVPNAQANLTTLAVNKHMLVADAVTNSTATLNTISMFVVDDTAFGNADSKDPTKNLRISYAIQNPSSSTLSLSESSNVTDRQDDVVRHISLRGYSNKPTELRVQNILDLDIVPINVNAMMRELPLTNLYNYSYTFDRMIVELFYGVGKELGMDLIRNLCSLNAGVAGGPGNRPNDWNPDVRPGNQHLDRNPPAAEKSSIAMFLSLLINPYKPLISSQSYAYLKGILIGDQGSGLQRPKYLSDQIYGKSLFGSMYDGQVTLGPNGELTSIPQGPAYGNSLINRQHAAAAGLGQFIPHNITGNFGWMGENPMTAAGAQPDTKLIYLKGNGSNTDTRNAPNTYGWADIKAVDVGVGTKHKLRMNSKLRTSTVLVRNLMLIVNSYRALRMKIANDFNYSKGSVSKSRYFTRENMTEFEGNDVVGF